MIATRSPRSRAPDFPDHIDITEIKPAWELSVAMATGYYVSARAKGSYGVRERVGWTAGKSQVLGRQYFNCNISLFQGRYLIIRFELYIQLMG